MISSYLIYIENYKGPDKMESLKGNLHLVIHQLLNLKQERVLCIFLFRISNQSLIDDQNFEPLFSIIKEI